MQAMLDLLEAISGDNGDTHPAWNERAVIALYAGGFAQMIPDYERAVAIYFAAADDFRALGPDAATASAFALTPPPAVQRRLGPRREAYATLMDARQIRREAHAPADGETINALRLAAAIAQELRDPVLLADELNAAAAVAFVEEEGMPPCRSGTMANAQIKPERLCAVALGT